MTSKERDSIQAARNLLPEPTRTDIVKFNFVLDDEECPDYLVGINEMPKFNPRKKLGTFEKVLAEADGVSYYAWVYKEEIFY